MSVLDRSPRGDAPSDGASPLGLLSSTDMLAAAKKMTQEAITICGKNCDLTADVVPPEPPE